jgi:hypothetical protein
MAFTPINFFAERAVYNATSYGEAPAIHRYISQDLLAEVATPGYFPDFFGLTPLEVKVNDVLVLMASNTRLLAVILSLEPVILTAFTDFPPNLVQQSITTQSNEYTGIWASNQPVLLDFVLQGNECMMTFPSSFDISTGGAFISFVSPVIIDALPMVDAIYTIEIMDNSIPEMGHMEIKTDGSVKVFRLDLSSFSIGGTAGFPTQTISYRTA